MFSVSSSAASYNADGLLIGSNRYASGHMDECTALLASPDDANFDPHEGYSEYLADQAVQSADERAAAEIVAGVAHAKAMLGTARVDLVRVLSVHSATGQPITTYVATVTAPGMMITAARNSPREAVDHAIERLDRRAGIVPMFAGFVVRGVALVQGWPIRPKADALALARRIALDPAYLTAALDFACPGVIPVTPAPLANAA